MIQKKSRKIKEPYVLTKVANPSPTTLESLYCQLEETEYYPKGYFDIRFGKVRPQEDNSVKERPLKSELIAELSFVYRTVQDKPGGISHPIRSIFYIHGINRAQNCLIAGRNIDHDGNITDLIRVPLEDLVDRYRILSTIKLS